MTPFEPDLEADASRFDDPRYVHLVALAVYVCHWGLEATVAAPVSGTPVLLAELLSAAREVVCERRIVEDEIDGAWPQGERGPATRPGGRVAGLLHVRPGRSRWAVIAWPTSRC